MIMIIRITNDALQLLVVILTVTGCLMNVERLDIAATSTTAAA